jgi:hypothetical protein
MTKNKIYDYINIRKKKEATRSKGKRKIIHRSE